MGPWESTPSTSIHEHHVRCTGRSRSWAHGRAPHPRGYTSILCAAQVPIHEHPRAYSIDEQKSVSQDIILSNNSRLRVYHSK